MFTEIVTTITTKIDLASMEPVHEVDIAASDELPTELIYAAVAGGCKATLNSLADGSPMVKHILEEDDEDEE